MRFRVPLRTAAPWADTLFSKRKGSTPMMAPLGCASGSRRRNILYYERYEWQIRVSELEILKSWPRNCRAMYPTFALRSQSRHPCLYLPCCIRSLLTLLFLPASTLFAPLISHLAGYCDKRITRFSPRENISRAVRYARKKIPDIKLRVSSCQSCGGRLVTRLVFMTTRTFAVAKISVCLSIPDAI